MSRPLAMSWSSSTLLDSSSASSIGGYLGVALNSGGGETMVFPQRSMKSYRPVLAAKLTECEASAQGREGAETLPDNSITRLAQSVQNRPQPAHDASPPP